jgi:hypothetical protein
MHRAIAVPVSGVSWAGQVVLAMPTILLVLTN